VGVCDFRPEKGAGVYGQWEIVSPTDPRFLSILKEGREAQDAALADPDPYDKDTRDLLEWFNAEIKERAQIREQTKKKAPVAA
jgi:hypothetical protein